MSEIFMLNISMWLSSHPFLLDVVLVIAKHGDVVFIALWVFYMLVHTEKGMFLGIQNTIKHIRELFASFFVGGFAWVIASIVKVSTRVPRPFEAIPSFDPLFRYGSLDSFPSGHATFFGALAVYTFLLHPRAGAWFLFGAFLIGISRMLAGVHYPVDIVVGFIIGGIIGWIGKRFMDRWL
jgi:membrane-associated phospholipid phosphatase